MNPLKGLVVTFMHFGEVISSSKNGSPEYDGKGATCDAQLNKMTWGHTTHELKYDELKVDSKRMDGSARRLAATTP